MASKDFIVKNGLVVGTTSDSASSGQLAWHDSDGTVQLSLGGVLKLKLGQQNYYYAKANEDIAKGDLVMFAGAEGDHILVAKADQSAVGFLPQHVMGIAPLAIANNAFGHITAFGAVEKLDTSSYTAGDLLYMDPDNAGQLTTTKPSPPDHILLIAAVTRSNANEGVMIVRPTHQPDTSEVPENSTNLYYTTARHDSDFDERLVGGTGITVASGDVSITPTGVTAGIYGSSTTIPRLTINASGQVDSAGVVTLADITSSTYDSATGQITINTADGNAFTHTVTLDPFSTGDLSEGSNLYYTTTRADSDFDVRLGTKSTTHLGEGSNLYYTTARADSDFDVRLATKDTGDLTEGSNLYYTTARFDSDFSTGGAFTSNVTFNDNTKAIFGDSSDLQIYHSGGASYIEDAGTGSLILKSNGTDVRIIDTSSNELVKAATGAAVTLGYGASGTRLTTTASGVDITGKIRVTNGGFSSFDNLIDIRDDSNDTRLQFTRTDTSANAWVGIPSWNDDAFYIYGPTSSGNEVAAIYTNQAWSLYGGGSSKLTTNSTGIDVNGTIVTDALTSSGLVKLDYNNPRIDFVGDDSIIYRVAVDETNNRLTLGHSTNRALFLANTGDARFGYDLTVDSDLTVGGVLKGPATFYIDPAPVDSDAGLLIIRGNLQVDGTTTTVNSTTVSINDKNIILADSAANASEADGAGITVNGASASITYDGTNDRWELNKDLNIDGAFPKITLTETDNSDTYTLISQNFGYLTIDNDAGSTDAGHGIIIKMDGNEAARITSDKDFTWQENNGGTPQVGMHWDYTDGRLGIGNGATTPSAGVSASAKGLHIAHSNVPFLALDNTTASTGKKYTLYSNTSGSLVFYDVTGAATRMLIASDGDVGIGTNNPANRLHVTAGSVGNTLNDTITHAEISGGRHHLDFREIRTANNSDWNHTTYQLGMRVDTTRHQSIDFVSDGSYAEHIDIKTGNQVFHSRFTSTGRLGIGTTNPGGQLTHYTGANRFQSFQGAGADLEIVSDNGTNPVVLIKGTGVADIVNVFDGGTEVFTILDGGNVGIGKTNPSGLLDMQKSTSSQTNLTVRNPVTGSGVSTLANFTNNIDADLQFKVTQVGVTDPYAHIGPSVSGQDLSFGQGGDRDVTITSEGLVGIGTTQPGQTVTMTAGGLTVNGTGGTQVTVAKSGNLGLAINAGDPVDGAAKFYDRVGGSWNEFLTGRGGKVGIGTDNPDYRLEVQNSVGDSSPAFKVEGTGSGAAFTWISEQIVPSLSNGKQVVSVIGKARSANNMSYFGHYHTSDGSASNYMTFGLYGANYLMNIFASGKVGIGTSSPNANLDIFGAAAAGNISLQLRSGDVATVADAAQIAFAYDNSSSYRHTIRSRHNSGADGGNAIDFYVWSSSQGASALGSNHVMTIDGNGGGMVGIGTTSPKQPLHFGGIGGYYASIGRGNSTPGGSDPWLGLYNNATIGDATFGWGFYDSNTNGALSIWNRNNSTTGYDVMTFMRGGNVGIGTDNPDNFYAGAANLVVGSGSGDEGITIFTGTTSKGRIHFADGTSGAAEYAGFVVYDHNANKMLFGAGADGGTDMYIENGKVGINTSSAFSTLHVNGRITGDGSGIRNTRAHNNATPGNTGFIISGNVKKHDTGKNLPTVGFRGIVWTGKHYLATDHTSDKVHIFDANLDATTFIDGSASITIPLEADSPHGATWDGRYLYYLNYSGGTIYVTACDLNDITSATAAKVQSWNVSSIISSSGMYGIGYAEGLFYVCDGGYVRGIDLDPDGTVTEVVTFNNTTVTTMNSQYVTYDGSYLYMGQNGTDIYRATLDGDIVEAHNNEIPDCCGMTWNGNHFVGFDYNDQDLYRVIVDQRIPGDLYLGNNDQYKSGTSGSTGTFNAIGRLKFDNSHSANADAPKIIMHNNGSDWLGGFGIHSSTVDYFSGGQHQFHVDAHGNSDGIITSKTTAMTIDSSARVGIGITNPTYKLQVSGTSYFSDYVRIEGTPADSSIKFTVAYTTSGENTIAQFGSAGDGIFLTSNSPLISTGMHYTNGWVATKAEGMYLNLAAGDFEMRYFSGATVGNLVTPSSVFKIDGSNKYVAIGHGSPEAPLDLQTGGNTQDGTYYSTFTINNTGSGTWSRIRFDRSGEARWGLSLGTDDKFKISNLYTSGSVANPDDSVFVIDNTSNIGIGTASPSGRLHLYKTNGDVELRMTADSSYDPIFRMTGENNSTSEGFTIRYDNSVGDTYFHNIHPATNAFHFNTSTTNDALLIKTDATLYTPGKIGIKDSSPIGNLQVGSNTFGGGNGVYTDDRVGISNHGALTSIVYASTYNSSSFPDYGMVFIHGPSTSSYNVWSISPDGPARGKGLDFIYGNGATNIHTTTAKITFDGNDGSIMFDRDGENRLRRKTTSSINSASTNVTEVLGRQIDLYAYDDIWLRAGTGDDIGFVAGGSERMRILSTGSVGIGVTDGYGDLVVGGKLYSPNENDRVLNWYNVTGGTEIHANETVIAAVHSSSNSGAQPFGVGLALYNPDSTNNNWSPAVTFGAESTSGQFATMGAAIAAKLPANADTNFRGGELHFFTAGTELTERGLVTQAVIKQDGKLGVGTTEPEATVDISSDEGKSLLKVRGNNGTMFEVTDSAEGTIFSVNDISGMPSLTVDDQGIITMAEHGGSVLIGTNVDDGTNTLQVSGTIKATATATLIIYNSAGTAVKTINGFDT